MQEDVKKEFPHHSSFVRAVLSGEIPVGGAVLLEVSNDIYADASLVTHPQNPSWVRSCSRTHTVCSSDQQGEV